MRSERADDVLLASLQLNVRLQRRHAYSSVRVRVEKDRQGGKEELRLERLVFGRFGCKIEYFAGPSQGKDLIVRNRKDCDILMYAKESVRYLLQLYGTSHTCPANVSRGLASP
jgi:hypothetical protein